MQPFITKHKDTLLGLLFLAFFSATVAFATRTTPFSPGETLNPNCAPDDPNCYVQLTSNTNQNSGGSSNQSSDGTITGTNLNITGVPATIAVPDGVLGASLQYGTEHGYPDNGYAHNYRVYSYKNTPGGKIFSSTYVTLPIPSGSIGDPGNLMISQQQAVSFGGYPNSSSVNYRIYAYKDVSGGRIYSTNYATLSSDFTPDNISFSPSWFSLSWDAVDGATGYRILKYDPANGANYTEGVDVLTNSYVDEYLGAWKHEAAITTSNGIFDQNQAQQLYTVNLSWNPVPGADGYRVIASNQNNNIGGESAYFGSLSENYDAGYDTTATSLIDDACYTVCFDRTKSDVSNNSGYSNLAILNGTFQISGPLVISKNGYINWGATAGTDGYGIRDNNGVMEYKDVGGSWTAITGGGGATSGLSLDGGGNLIANTVSSNIASSNSPYQSILLGQGAGDGINASSPYNILIGSHAGFHAYAIQQVIFLGSGAGDGATHAANSIFIGTNAGYGDTVDNTSSSGFSILLGPSTSTGGYSNSIAIGKSATNSATNQFMVGSNQYPIRQFVLVETGGQNAYINFINGNSSYGSSGYETGDLGYGFKDDNGTMKYKNEGGSWTAFGGGSTTPTLDGNNSFVVGGGSDPLFSNFIGIGAGQGATGAQASNFFGTSAGNNAYAANNSNFFGANAGRDAIFASSSNFFGSSAGNSATNAHDSNFLGNSAGYGATSAQNSNFFGQYAGYQATNAGFSIFLGPWAGYNAVSAYNSIFLGQSAGQSDNVNNTSNNGFSILLGPSTSTGGYSNSIAIGGTATNTKSNQLMLGSSSYPISDLSINNVNYTFPSSQGSSGQTLVNDGSGNLTWQTVGGVSLDTVDAFIVGGGADMVDSVFIGKNTGAGATSAHHSNFFGAGTGYGATNASGSNFLGNGAGYSAISASGSNFIGQNSGFYANNANDSIFLGNYAGSSATNAAFSTFIGGNAGQNATNAADAIFIGNAAGEGDTINTSYSGSYGHSAILIGNGTSTGGYIDSIAIGQGATNTKTNQLMLGSSGYPISALSINNVNYTFPASQGLLGQTLVNDGNGNLSWSTVGGGTGITSINGNTATAQTIAAGTGISISNNGNGTTTITNTSSSLLQFDGTNNSFYSATTPDTQGAVFLGYRAGFSPQSEYNSVAIGTQAGYYASLNSTIVGYQAGMNARYAELLNAFGMNAGYNAANARNSIFIGANAGYNDSVDNTSGGYSILIGTSTNTGGYSNSIAIGSNAINTATNQFMIGSSSYPINSTVIKGSGSTQCTITTGTGIACSSDITLKKNITAIPDGMLAKVLSLNPVTYNWKTQLDTDPTYAGFIAQQVEVIFPQAVSTDPSTGTKLLSPTVLIPFTIKAIQEMDIQMQGLASLKGDSGNTFKDALIAWFADVHNGINKLFVREIDTTKICVSDTTGATCITKGQLDKLLAR